jgi:glycosyltransferase involved in cell wall biosynthesis
LQKFVPTPRPDGPFTVMFASSPDRADWLDDRGVGLLLEVAKRRPDWRFLLVWRPWGTALGELRHRMLHCGVSNIEVVVGRFADMAQFFARSHVTVAPFLSRQRGKPIPNSILEGIACGRPSVVTELVGLSKMIADEGIGAVCDTNAESFINTLDVTERNWSSMSIAARTVAEKYFGRERFLGAYNSIYHELLAA